MGQLFLQFVMLWFDHTLKVITHSIVVKLHNTPPISLRFCESWHEIRINNSNV